MSYKLLLEVLNYTNQKNQFNYQEREKIRKELRDKIEVGKVSISDDFCSY